MAECRQFFVRTIDWIARSDRTDRKQSSLVESKIRERVETMLRIR